MKKRLLAILLAGVLCFAPALSVSAEDNSSRIAEIEAQIAQLQEELKELKEQEMLANGGSYISAEEYASLFTDASAYAGRDIKIAGKMFNGMEQDEEAKYFQMFYDLNGESKTVIVQCDLSSPDFTDGEYVLVTGKVIGTASGTNAFGGEVRALSIDADFVEKTDYASAVKPAVRALKFDLQVDQYGYVISIPKVEFAETETRVYVDAVNNGISTFNFSTYATKIVQGSTQYEIQYNYDADYPEVQSELLPGTQTSGIMTFPAMDPNTDIVVYFEGHSDNYDEKLQTYQFTLYLS